MSNMNAAVCTKFGPADVVSIQNIPRPEPKTNEILVKVSCSTVTAADLRIRAARFPGGFAPFARMIFGIVAPRRHILGSCFSGVVEKVGNDVATFQPGDEVCGMSSLAMGAHAEYMTIKANKSVVLKPKKISHADAAATLFGGTAALYFLKDKAKLSKGQSILVNGASGAVGSSAVQLAKHYGAKVTGIAGTENIAAVKKIGAQKVVDYKKQDVSELTERYDVVLDTVGNISIQKGKRLLKADGKLLLMVATLGQMLRPDKQVLTGTATQRPDDLTFLLTLVEKGTFKPLIDSSYNLENIVEAHIRAESSGKAGNIVVTMK